MDVGRMRELVLIQVATTSAAADGEYGQPSWKTLAKVNAEIAPLSGRERLQSQALQAGLTYRVILRDRSDVTAKAKLVCIGPDYDGSTMQIHAVVRNHRLGSMELDCSEVLV
jgi:SPP1 family predicted phage head-tail adaptor